MEILSRTVLRVMANPKSITSEDQEVLEKAIVDYPYFQLARTLVAKAKHDQQAPDAYESLGYAAIYSPDRRHLRKVFYEDLRIDWHLPEDETGEDTSVSVEATPFPEVEEQSATDSTIETPEPTEEAPSVLPPEAQETDQTIETTESETITASEEPEQLKETVDQSEPVGETATGVANHDEEEEMVYRELEENLRRLRKAKEESQVEDEEEDKKKITNSSEVLSNNPQSNVSTQSPLLLDYLHGIEPVSSERLGIHQQKQNELINKFVNSDSNPADRFRPALHQSNGDIEDLAEQSSTYSSQLVTENLAEIMLRQGKKGKAIEIYQQLMLKIPEKKAYFAEKIDQLKQL